MLQCHKPLGLHVSEVHQLRRMGAARRCQRVVNAGYLISLFSAGTAELRAICELSKKKTLRRLWPMEEETRIGGIPRVRGLDRIVRVVWGSRSSELRSSSSSL